jgi:microcystin-dependent protein
MGGGVMPYSAWAETRRNLWNNPLMVSTGTVPSSTTNGTVSFITTFPGVVATARRWVATVASAAARVLVLNTGLTTPAAGAKAHVMMHVIVSGGTLSGAYIAIRQANVTSASGQLQMPLGNLAPGEYWFDVSGITTATAAAAGGGVILIGTPTVIGTTVDVTEALVEANTSGPFFSGASADDDTLQNNWLTTANASPSVQLTRSFTYPPKPTGSKPIRPEDLLVEFRDKDLIRRGSIPVNDLKLKFQPVYNGVGSWLLTLPAEHRAVPYLRAPGAGIIITNLVNGEILMSGSTSKPSKKATISDPRGMVTIAGLDDNRLAFDARAFPLPTSSNVATQTVSHDVRTGLGSTIMRQYVNANIGPASPVGRRGSSMRNHIVLGPDPAVGLSTTQRARFDNLGDLLNKIAAEAGGVGWRIVQVGDTLEFQTYEPIDRSAFIRLDVVNGTLQETNVEVAPPEVTRPIVAGQGEGAERQFVQVTTTESEAAEDDWGLIIEDFKDQRNTGVETELIDSGLGDLHERGFTKIAVKAVPSNDQTMIFLTDFFLGDRVAIVIDGQEQPNSNITEAAIVIDETGMKTAVAIGDVADFDSDSALRQTVNDTQRRVDSLERNLEIGTATAGLIVPFGGTTIPDGWLLCDGRAVSRTTFSALYARIGTTYGVGDGSTTFNLPDGRGRVFLGAGLGTAGTAVNHPAGEKGGQEREVLSEAQLAVHKHNLSGHAVTWGQGNVAFGTPNAYAGTPPGNSLGTWQNTVGYSTTLDAGGGQSHNNLPPYQAVGGWIISTGVGLGAGVAPTVDAGDGISWSGSGVAEDPYRPNLDMDWASLGGPMAHTGDTGGPYACSWFKGVSAGKPGGLNPFGSKGVTIGEYGLYECFARQRGAVANAYICLALSGNREALENRTDGMYDHDHTAAADNFSTSHYIGYLEAGLVVTMGPQSGQGGTMRFGNQPILGTLTVKRLR